MSDNTDLTTEEQRKIIDAALECILQYEQVLLTVERLNTPYALELLPLEKDKLENILKLYINECSSSKDQRALEVGKKYEIALEKLSKFEPLDKAIKAWAFKDLSLKTSLVNELGEEFLNQKFSELLETLNEK